MAVHFLHCGRLSGSLGSADGIGTKRRLVLSSGSNSCDVPTTRASGVSSRERSGSWLLDSIPGLGMLLPSIANPSPLVYRSTAKKGEQDGGCGRGGRGVVYCTTHKPYALEKKEEEKYRWEKDK